MERGEVAVGFQELLRGRQRIGAVGAQRAAGSMYRKVGSVWGEIARHRRVAEFEARGCQYLYFCTRRCQYLYFCTMEAEKLGTGAPLNSKHAGQYLYSCTSVY